MQPLLVPEDTRRHTRDAVLPQQYGLQAVRHGQGAKQPLDGVAGRVERPQAVGSHLDDVYTILVFDPQIYRVTMVV